MGDDNAVDRDEYEILSRFYDLEYDAFDADLEFYRQFARRAAGPVLELGCGTGRVLRALADLGLPLTGVDISDAMLAIARTRLPDSVELLARDMQWVDEPRPPANAPYALAFVALNTFLHLPDAIAQLQTLATLRELVTDDGLLMLDIFVPDLAYLTDLDGRPVHRFTATLENGARLDKWAVHTHDLASQLIDTTIFFDVAETDGTLRRYVDQYKVRYIHRFELEHLVERAGWQVVSLFGNYELDPYDSESERMLLLATPADTSDSLGNW